jgi:hypothetical protein
MMEKIDIFGQQIFWVLVFCLQGFSIGPVRTSSDITSESGFFAGLVNAREAKKVSAM